MDSFPQDIERRPPPTISGRSSFVASVHSTASRAETHSLPGVAIRTLLLRTCFNVFYSTLASWTFRRTVCGRDAAANNSQSAFSRRLSSTSHTNGVNGAELVEAIPGQLRNLALCSECPQWVLKLSHWLERAPNGRSRAHVSRKLSDQVVPKAALDATDLTWS